MARNIKAVRYSCNTIGNTTFAIYSLALHKYTIYVTTAATNILVIKLQQNSTQSCNKINVTTDATQ